MNNQEKIYKAIKEHSELGDNEIIDASKHGADGGFNGFIYNTDIENFFRHNEILIIETLTGLAVDFGHKNWLELLIESNNNMTWDVLVTPIGYKTLSAFILLEMTGNWLSDRMNT